MDEQQDRIFEILKNLEFCVSYLLPCNKLDLSGSKQQTFIILHKFAGQKFGSSLAGWCWLRVPHWVVVKMLAKTTVILRLDLMLLIGLTDVAVGGALPRYIDSVGLLGVFSHYGNQLFPGASDPKQQGRSCDIFYDLALEVTLHYFYTSYLVT